MIAFFRISTSLGPHPGTRVQAETLLELYTLHPDWEFHVSPHTHPPTLLPPCPRSTNTVLTLLAAYSSSSQHAVPNAESVTCRLQPLPIRFAGDFFCLT